MEEGFILDGIPLSKVANDETDRTNPTLNLGIPQYYGKKDPHCCLYYSRKKGQEKSIVENNSSMMGNVYDKYINTSSSNSYIEDRRKLGAGMTYDLTKSCL